MQNVTLCMRTWCEVRNFSSQKFRLTPDRKQPTVFDINYLHEGVKPTEHVLLHRYE